MYPRSVPAPRRASRSFAPLLLAWVGAACAACGASAGDTAGPGSPVALAGGGASGGAAAAGASVRPGSPAPSSSPGAAAPSAASPDRLRTATRPLPRDIAELRDLRGVTISADGARVAYLMRVPRFDPKATPSPDDTRAGWTVEQQLWLVDRRGGESRQLTTGTDPVVGAHFSPDGRDMAFLRSRRGKTTLHVLPLAGGESRALDLGDHQPRSFVWTPDGRSLVFTATVPRSAADKKARWQRGGAVAWDREWEPTHLFVVGRAGGTPRRIDQGSDNIIAFHLSPDGKRLALVTSPSSDAFLAFIKQRLVIVRASDGGVERELEKPTSVIQQVEWSPDGRSLAYSTTARGYSHIDQLRVVGADRAGAAVDAAAGLDLSLTAFHWTADSRSLIAASTGRTRTTLHRLSARGGAATRLRSGDLVVQAIASDGGGRFAAASVVGPRAPGDPAVIDLATGKIRVVAVLNPQVEAWSFAPTELVAWTNKEGVKLEGLLTRTASGGGGGGGGKAPPLLVIPHGGPDSVSMNAWNDWSQFFAARGYSVFSPNYRGGIGYGRAFYEANRGRLGDIELMDIESGVDHLIAAGKADPDRLFYGSWSWGGYLAAWTLGHSKRYRAMMVGAGVVDVAVQYVISDINHGEVADWEFKGRPWNQPETFERPNPSRFLKGATTPTLILHGMEDQRVGFINAQILYRALSDLGVEVSMWAYPRENHGFEEPAHVQHLLQVWAAWNDAHLPR